MIFTKKQIHNHIENEHPSSHWREQTELEIRYELKGFPSGSAGKESACNVGDLGLIPGLGRSPGEGKGYPLWYSCLENSMDCTSPGSLKESDTTEQLSLFTMD